MTLHNVDIIKTIKNIIALLFLTALTGCSTTHSDGPKYENILLQLPVPGSGWTFGSDERGDETIKTWAKANESFKVSIYHERFRPEPEQFRNGLDNTARENLVRNLESKELKLGLVNNYPMVLWQTAATLKDDTKITSLFLYIKGNDATYLVRRRWTNREVSEAELKTWTDYMLTISVCDDRHREHQSPKMEEQSPGIYIRTDATNNVPH